MVRAGRCHGSALETLRRIEQIHETFPILRTSQMTFRDLERHFRGSGHGWRSPRIRTPREATSKGSSSSFVLYSTGPIALNRLDTVSNPLRTSRLYPSPVRSLTSIKWEGRHVLGLRACGVLRSGLLLRRAKVLGCARLC